MLQKYSVMNGRIVQGDEGSIQVEVYIMPDEAERSRLINEYEMNRRFGTTAAPYTASFR